MTSISLVDVSGSVPKNLPYSPEDRINVRISLPVPYTSHYSSESHVKLSNSRLVAGVLRRFLRGLPSRCSLDIDSRECGDPVEVWHRPPIGIVQQRQGIEGTYDICPGHLPISLGFRKVSLTFLHLHAEERIYWIR